MRFSPTCNCCAGDCSGLVSNCCSGSLPAKLEVTLPDEFVHNGSGRCTDSSKCPAIGDAPYVLDDSTACVEYTHCTCATGADNVCQPTSTARHVWAYRDTNWCDTDHELQIWVNWECEFNGRCDWRVTLSLEDSSGAFGGNCNRWQWRLEVDADQACDTETWSAPFDAYDACNTAFCTPSSGLSNVTFKKTT